MRQNKPQQGKDKEKKTVGKYVLYPNEILGTGAFGTTCHSRSKNDPNKKFACKIMNKKSIQNIVNDIKYLMEMVQREAKAWKELDHPNIVKFEASEETKNNIYFFLQLCPNGSLQEYIVNHRFEQNFGQIIDFSKQIVQACAYLESKNVVHRDIKPANILIKNDLLKLGDFGLARAIKEEGEQKIISFITFAGTLQYMAPQILMHKKYSSKCDVWSVGVTLFRLFTSYLPFKMKQKDLSEQLLLNKIMNEKEDFDFKVFKENPKITEILKKMLEIDSEVRPSISEVRLMFKEL